MRPRIATFLCFAAFALVGVPTSHAQSASGDTGPLVSNAFINALMRLPKPEEFSSWQVRIEADGLRSEDVFQELLASEERSRLKRHRRVEREDLLASALPILIALAAVFFTVGRKSRRARILFIVFAFLFVPLFFDYDYVYDNAHFGDFPSFYFSADYVYNQERSPYGHTLAEEVERHIFPFFHPPPSIAIFYPLSHMSLDIARRAALWGNMVALILLLYLLIIKDRESDGIWLAGCLLLYTMNFHPLHQTVVYGQVNFWTTIFICLTIYGYWKGKSDAWIGLSLACAAIIKIYPILLFGYLLLKKRWAAMAWCLAGIGFFVVLGLLTIPWPIWQSWWENVGSRGGYGSIAPIGLFSPAGPWNQGLNGFFLRIFTDSQFNAGLLVNPELGRLLTYAVAGLVAGSGALLLWLRDRRGLTDAVELEMGFVLVIMSLIVPLSWIHHGVMLLPAILATARELVKNPRPLPAWVFCIAAFTMAWEWSPLDSKLAIFKGGYTVLLGSLRAFALMGLYATVFILLAEPWRKRSRSDPMVTEA